ncbi:MAG: hypothetical protein RR588_00240 [Solibacillus sp.]
MISKDISVATKDFCVETSANVDCGFLLTMTSYVDESNKHVSEIFVGIEDAEQIIQMFQESITFSKSLKE